MIELYPYQLDGVEQIERFDGRCLLADQMGLGKTAQGLVWMRRYSDPPAVVVCPAAVKYNWQREARRFTRIRAEVLEGRKPPNGWKASRKLVIINYDILEAWERLLMRLKPNLVIFDEVQYLKNLKAKRTKACRRLAGEVPHVIGMSGTPITNRPAELYSFLSILDPVRWNSFYRFAWTFCEPKHNGFGWKYDGAKNLDGLHQTLRKTCMIRRLKQEVLRDLPEKSRCVVPLAVDLTEYRHAQCDFSDWYDRQGRMAPKAEALAKVGALKRLAARLKLDGVISWIDDFLESSDDKLVVFAIHKQILTALEERYQERCVRIDGSVTGLKRQQAVDLFQLDLARHASGPRVLIGNIQAAGIGLNLTVAHTVAFAEMGWTPAEHQQAEDRIHRIGQQRGCQAYYLVAKGTMEEKLCELLHAKQQVLDQLLDGKETSDDVSVFDLLLQSLGKEER